MIIFTSQLRHALRLLPLLLTCALAAARGEETVAPAPAPVTAESKGNLLAANKAAEAKGLLALGVTLTDRNDFSAAEIAYRQILNSGDFSLADQKDALLGIARTYRRSGSFTKAAAIYEKFLKQFPEENRVPDALLDLGRTLRAMGAYRLAISRFYSVINSTLKLPTEGFDHYQLLAKTAQYEIAETHFEAGEYAEAGKFFSRVRLLDLAASDRARAHFKSACALQLSGDLEGAVSALRTYLDQWPQDENVAEARYLLATTLRQMNRTDEALTATLALLREQQAGASIDPKRWAYWQRRTGNQLANEFFQSGDTINALAIYQGLTALSPDPVWRLPAIYQIALCYERLRLTDRARSSYQSILDAVAQAPAPKDGAVTVTAADLNELAHMARWRLAHLDWNEQTERQLTAFFSTTTGRRAPAPAVPPTPADDINASPAATPAAVR